MREEALVFTARNQQLLGILHRVEAAPSSVGVLIVVGGPQYRAGSHRQFVLLARELAKRGIPCFRFDYCGMGDSEGEQSTFEAVAPDIRAAIDVFQAREPSIQRVTLWGLCDGASAALMYAPDDSRVAGLVLLNPWVRSEQGLAQSYLRTYYPRRVLNPAFWRKVMRNPAAMLRSAVGLLATFQRSRRREDSGMPTDFRMRMLHALKAFSGQIVLLLSGNDLTAGEFRALVAASPEWQGLLQRPSVQWLELSDANHTFSSHEWRSWVSERTVMAVQSMEREP